MKKLLIIGTGGQGKVVLDCALSRDEFSDIAFLTNDNSQISQVAGFPVYQEKDVLSSSQNRDNLPLSFLREYDESIIAIGNNKVRLVKSKQFLENGIKLATLIHSHAVVSRFSEIHAGTVVFANAVVNPFSKIGIACIINTGVIVEHDCIIGNGVHISPNASIAGTVSVGEKSWICVGSSISNNVNIGANCVIGAGSVVLEDMPHYVLAAGIPAKIKKHYAIDYVSSYRRATFEDCDLIFKWANDPQTRENSHNKEPIEYENHVSWFQNKLESNDSWMFIILKNDIPVGLLRLDKNDDDVLVSYSVASESRRMGIGQEIIYMLPEIIKNEKIDCNRIIAEVFKTDDASNKIFLNAGYRKNDDNTVYTYVYKLK